MKYDLSGKWKISLSDQRVKEDGFLPASLDENEIGDEDKVAKAWHPDVEERNKEIEKNSECDSRIATRLTRKFTYEGAATFTRSFDKEVSDDKRYFLFLERTRKASLMVDGKDVKVFRWGLSTPTIFELTGLLKKGSELAVTVDNTYPGLPYRDITFSSAATDETQTNWNGIIGDIYIEEKNEAILSDVRVYPELSGEGTIDVHVEISFPESEDKACAGYYLKLEGECLDKEIVTEVNVEDGNNTIKIEHVELNDKASENRWDEEDGKLHTIKVTLLTDCKNVDCDECKRGNLKEYNSLDEKTVRFGLRYFGYDESGRLTLNGRRIFLRGEANCGLFPETGHPPMDKKSWLTIMETYASYGVNCVRFHSWCPPEAAFCAADELGMLVQPELPNWNPRDAFSSDESRTFYRNEIKEIVKCYANHPSFVMLTLGNELHTDEAGIEEMHNLMRIARKIDSTRLYAWGSNNFYGAKGTDNESDFYTSSNVGSDVLRLAVAGNNGIINSSAPCTDRNFDAQMKNLRAEYDRPFFSFEVGQYEILPDMHELELFKGVTRPDNLLIVRDRIKTSGLSFSEYEKRVSATGELSLLAYREEIEAVLRTPEMSGISLLGLQDFTGQGTALVGMLNSHLRPKSYPFADCRRFKAFFKAQTVLVLMDRYTYTTGDVLKAEVKVANYGKTDISGDFSFELALKNNDGKEQLYFNGEKKNDYSCKAGELTSLGFLEIPLSQIDESSRFDLKVSVENIEAAYPIWVYPETNPVCPSEIYETRVMDEKALDVLKSGGKVYFSPDSTKEAIPDSIKAQFTTDFWSVGTFPFQEGAMGQLIDDKHPIFRNFPTEYHSNWQWFHMASQRAFILPGYMKTIVAEMDSYVSLRSMAQLFEAKYGNGKILCSSMNLHNLQEYPEARALQDSIYKYMVSPDFAPTQEMYAL
ncbi:glycoside hydrolase family 2 TIM barrel-domain containing protein [Butyrivibrio sp. YAB3001]|uniref:glycoside hydrolase family 2 TIM barrel-domain containing protein n=1 Tax=Butyrivibrio sp. YAB3001 TaxID=1520812 RepID=UPI0008F64994|nr:glycoside hydrolase family 2 TIM barrel-domain containing protein [Butyrivibrio sp. YAB3001]SFC49265.1 Glycosyl hydrolases family 2 [Butyrivibrio sp. YAB3001]